MFKQELNPGTHKFAAWTLIRTELGSKLTLLNMKFGYKETFCKEKEQLKTDIPVK